MYPSTKQMAAHLRRTLVQYNPQQLFKGNGIMYYLPPQSPAVQVSDTTTAAQSNTAH